MPVPPRSALCSSGALAQVPMHAKQAFSQRSYIHIQSQASKCNMINIRTNVKNGMNNSHGQPSNAVGLQHFRTV